MKSIIRKSVSLLLVTIATCCISPYEVPVKPTGGEVVISGTISTEAEFHKLNIGITASTNRTPIPVDDAVAYLFDDLGRAFRYEPIGSGQYQLQDKFEGVVGGSYVVDVTLSDGRNYRSRAQRIPDLNADTVIAKAVYKNIATTDVDGVVINRPYFEVQASSALPTESLFLRWTVEEVYQRSPTDFPDAFNTIPPPCFAGGAVDPQKINIFSGFQNTERNIQTLPVALRIIDRSFLEKHYFIVKQHSINFESYEYWRKVNILANQVGSIFDVPPALITGNIASTTNPNERVFGFFEARNTILTRIPLFASDVPFFLEQICFFEPGKPIEDYATECLNCLVLPNSTNVPPPWF